MQTSPTGYAESHRIAEQIFREILPRHVMAVREEQIALCHEVLDTLYNKEISLCEAGVLQLRAENVVIQADEPDFLKQLVQQPVVFQDGHPGICQVEDWINNYPREIHGFRSANSVFAEGVAMLI